MLTILVINWELCSVCSMHTSSNVNVPYVNNVQHWQYDLKHGCGKNNTRINMYSYWMNGGII